MDPYYPLHLTLTLNLMLKVEGKCKVKVKVDNLMPWFSVSESMVGDVNLFFNDKEDKTTAEVEVMIAGWLIDYEISFEKETKVVWYLQSIC